MKNKKGRNDYPPLRLIPKVRNIAHRGASAEAPENTPAAFRRALAMGVDYIELDLHRTRDGVLVVIHDDRVDRTTDGRGFIHELSLAQVRALDAGSWFPRGGAPRARRVFAGERIPTLQEVIDLVRPTATGLYLEIKPGPGSAPGMVAALVDRLARNRFDTRVVVASFDHAAVAEVKRLNPALRTCALFERPVADPAAAALTVGAEEVAPFWMLATPKFIERAHRANLPVIVWTVDTAPRMRRMLARGVDGLFTNNPARLKQLLDNL